MHALSAESDGNMPLQIPAKTADPLPPLEALSKVVDCASLKFTETAEVGSRKDLQRATAGLSEVLFQA